MRREYALIAALLATTAAIAVVSRGDNSRPAQDSVPQAATPAPPDGAPLAVADPESRPEAVVPPVAVPRSEGPAAAGAVAGPDASATADLEATLRDRAAEHARLTATLDATRTNLEARDARIRDIETQLVARSAEVRILEAEIEVLQARSAYQAELAALRAGRAPVPAETTAAAAPLTPATPDALDDALAEAKGPPSAAELLSRAAARTAPPPPALPQVFAEIHFESASSALTPGGRERVRAAAAALSGMPLAGVEVFGYTDTVGSREANRRLAARRADSVAVALTEAGLAGELIASTGLGETGAPVLTGRGVAEPLNRSVEIVARPALP